MENLQVRAIIAGISFGIWPLVLNKSGLRGIVSPIVYTALVMTILLPFSYGMWDSIADVRWKMVAIACTVGAIGLYSFNSMLGKADPGKVSELFVLMIIVQSAIPALYKAFLTGGLTASKCLGFVLAAVAAALLIKE